MTRKQKRWLWTSAAILAALAVITGKTSLSQEDEAASGEHEPGSYEVVDGDVDEATFQGYRAYGRSCMACHGPDGVGSSFAPSLLRIVERRTFEEFEQVVREGQDIQPGRVMPPFNEDEYVMEHVGHIYSYLKARADGELGRGRPGVIGEDE